MDRSRLRPVAVALAVAGVLAGIAALRRIRRRTSPELFTSEPSPTSPGHRGERRGGRRGRPEDRGRGPSFGLDVDRLKETGGFEPVVHYLTYIQEQRGDGSHLLFVRYDDLDAMAEIDGEPTPSFLERLEQLGVVVSTN